MAKPIVRPSIHGTDGPDVISGTDFGETISGHGGNDTIYGNGGDDTIYGQEGDDIVNGGAGSDVIGFGNGSDTMTGGSGADRFFGAAWEWTNQSPWISVITDFEVGHDLLDLSRFDADERTVPGIIRGGKTPGNEAFQLVANTDGVTPGHLDISYGTDLHGGAITIVSGYTDTAPGADIVIHLAGTINPTAGDFIL